MRRLSLLLLLLTLSPQPAMAQGIVESGSVRALSAGLGAGLAGSLNHGQFVQRSYETLVEAQQAAALQTKQINDYFQRGMQFEKGKQWNYAEASLDYVLKLIARRDGPGSPNSLPVLSHLSRIAKSQNKLDQAINYQKTVVALTDAHKKNDPAAVLEEHRTLSDLFIQKKDYASAKEAVKAEAALFEKFPTLPRNQLKTSV